MEIHAYGGAHVPNYEDRRRPPVTGCCQHVGLGQWAAAAWPMQFGPWVQKERINHMWPALRWRRRMGGRRLRMMAVLVLLAVEKVEVVVEVPPLWQGGLVSRRALFANSLPVFQTSYHER